ncbi:MAG: MFS transporter, partial [Dietzia sp.]|nr:MFS transporter [Dietzia sp.]
MDFLLPLFAGAAIGLTPSQIGLLLALEVAASFAMRPVAGSLADRFERRGIAAAGALLYGLSCAGYAMTPEVTGAYVAATVGGIGGALLWVALRAMIGERMAEDSGSFARLAVAEEGGSWAVFVPILALVGVLGYETVFFLLAGLSLIGAIALLTAPRLSQITSRTLIDPGAEGDEASRSEAGLLRRLSPMLLTVALTMTAEGLISLLLLLHLQQEFALDPWQIGLVFLPGGIVMGVLPPFLHGLVRRYGRTRVLALASIASAGFAFSLAFAPNPIVIA